MALHRGVVLTLLLAVAWALPSLASFAQSAKFSVDAAGNISTSGDIYMPNASGLGGMVVTVDSNGKLTPTSPTISTLSALITSPVAVYNSATLLISPKVLIKNGTVTGGSSVFYLTTDGSSIGTAIFSNVYGVNVDINAADAAYGYSWAVTNSNRTLTVTVVKPGSLLGLGLIPYAAASNGVNINVRVFGN